MPKSPAGAVKRNDHRAIDMADVNLHKSKLSMIFIVKNQESSLSIVSSYDDDVESWKETSMQENWYLLHFSI